MKKGQELSTLADLMSELQQDSGFRQAYERQRPYYNFLGLVINRRKELGLSQSELAERLGMHQSAISRLESGEYNVSLGKLMEIAEALHAELDVRLLPKEDRVEIKRLYVASDASTSESLIIDGNLQASIYTREEKEVVSL